MYSHRADSESRPAPDPGSGTRPENDSSHQPTHSMWWMVACCAPMVLFALAILFGYFGPR